MVNHDRSWSTMVDHSRGAVTDEEDRIPRWKALVPLIALHKHRPTHLVSLMLHSTKEIGWTFDADEVTRKNGLTFPFFDIDIGTLRDYVEEDWANFTMPERWPGRT